jgi:hypothetical protein
MVIVEYRSGNDPKYVSWCFLEDLVACSKWMTAIVEKAKAENRDSGCVIDCKDYEIREAKETDET